jgi:hypothetical protein
MDNCASRVLDSMDDGHGFIDWFKEWFIDKGKLS